jgi:hypothetical protein
MRPLRVKSGERLHDVAQTIGHDGGTARHADAIAFDRLERVRPLAFRFEFNCDKRASIAGSWACSGFQGEFASALTRLLLLTSGFMALSPFLDFQRSEHPPDRAIVEQPLAPSPASTLDQNGPDPPLLH